MLLYLLLLTETLRRSGTRRRELLWENLALRQQLAVYQRQTHRPPLRQRDRVFWFLLVRRCAGWRGALVFVQPETIIRWHRAGWRRYWTWRSRGRRPGRPRISLEVQAVIRQLAQENPRWGASRLAGELQALGFDVSVRTVGAIGTRRGDVPRRSAGAPSSAIMLPRSGRRISSPSRP